MIPKFEDSLALLKQAQKLELYQNLVTQIKKDFGLANVDLKITMNPKPEELRSEIHEKIYLLLLERFPEYLNLLYVVDVSEEKVSHLETNDVVDMAATVSFMILEREFQKVKFRQQY